MKTFKIGSRGEGVKTIQRIVGATPVDGIFGNGTAAALKTWQRAHGLTADGVAGPATLQKMMGITITQGYIYKHITRAANRTVKYIAIHYTAGSSSKSGKALATKQVFLSRAASADFVVDDATVVQINPDLDNYCCWAVGDKKNTVGGGGRLYGVAINKNTVSIEICSTLKSGTTAAIPNHEGWSFTDKALENARRVVRYLMVMYDIPKSNVVRHYDVSGKLCPGVIGWNDAPLYSTDGKSTTRKNNSSMWVAFHGSI